MECLAGIPGMVGGSPIQNIGAYGQEVSSVISGLRALDLHAPRLDAAAFQELPASQLGFAYRSSVFNTTQKNRFLITRVDFELDPAMQPNLVYADLAPASRHPLPRLWQVAQSVREIRAAKGMYLDPASPSPDHRSAGSFFKNPVVAATLVAAIARTQAIAESAVPRWPTPSGQVKLPAAWLIEQAGFPKGFASRSGRHLQPPYPGADQPDRQRLLH